MKKDKTAFEKTISKGKVRILLKVSSVLCVVENKASDFLKAVEDNCEMIVRFSNEKLNGDYFNTRYSLTTDGKKSSETELYLSLEEEIFFDLNIDEVSEVWSSELEFEVNGSRPKYLNYFVRSAEYTLEWLQPNEKTGNIAVLSSSNRVYKGKREIQGMTFTSEEVIRCADTLNRAIKKIDLRTKSAIVKFNTEDNPNLEGLIVEMADRLGYEVEALDQETIYKLEQKGNRISHQIKLKSDY